MVKKKIEAGLKKRTIAWRPMLLLGIVFLIAGCAFPRIIILKDPLTPEEHLNLGVAYENRGEFDQAIREYELAAKRLPLAYLYLGNAYFQKKDWDRAEKQYRKAMRKDPRNADVCNNLAWLYYTKKENREEAEKLALRAIELNPAKEHIYRDTLEKIREWKKEGPRSNFGLWIAECGFKGQVTQIPKLPDLV